MRFDDVRNLFVRATPVLLVRTPALPHRAPLPAIDGGVEAAGNTASPEATKDKSVALGSRPYPITLASLDDGLGAPEGCNYTQQIYRPNAVPRDTAAHCEPLLGTLLTRKSPISRSSSPEV